MPSQLNFNPLRALDANGDPIPGALATFFETGTSTPITVYTDGGLGTPHASPLVADAEGVFAPAFTDGATAVKVQMTTAGLVQVNGYPIDPVQLISSTGSAASAVTFAPITGNAATDVQDAIQNLTTLWNAVTTFGRDFAASANAAAGRTELGLGGLATLEILDEDDFVSNSNTRPPSQQSTKAYVDANNTPILAVLEDQKSSGTAAASITANTWTTRELNTEVRDVNSVITLTSNEFVSTVDAWVEWSAPGTDTFSTRLYNVTDAVEVAKGQSLVLGSVYYGLSTGGAAITAGKTYAIQQNQSATRNAGAAASDGTEVYTRVKIFAN